MTTPRPRSDQEISDLLDQYGIKHGPIVDTTRKLYEKKLNEVMAKGKPSSDKTYYREEQEEVTYVHYRTPLRNENMEDSFTGRRFIRPEYTKESAMDYVNEPSFRRTEASYSHVSRSKPPPTKQSHDGLTKDVTPQQKRFIPLWFQFLVFLIVAVFLYFVFTNMETPEDNPFKKLE